MPSYDYNAQQFHIASRGNISTDLLPGIFPADRANWDREPHFLGWPAHLQRLHATITEASDRLIAGLEATLDEPDSSAQELMGLTGMNRLGRDLVAHVHGHHAFEDHNVLPGFLSRFPQLSTAIDLLENDHQVLDRALDHAEEVFSILQGQKTSKSQIGKAQQQAKLLDKILNRHTYDEEDILIPAVLHAYG